MNIVDQEIEKLQDNLQAIRKIAGWTTEELGEQIGVTKQTISNLERKATKMTKTQYIAIRAVIDYEILTNENSDTLRTVVDVLLNSDEDEKKEVDETSKQFQELVGNSSSKEDLKKKENAKKTLAATAGVLGLTAIALADNPAILLTTMNWLSKIIKKK